MRKGEVDEWPSDPWRESVLEKVVFGAILAILFVVSLFTDKVDNAIEIFTSEQA
jgi:hypothetical protein